MRICTRCDDDYEDYGQRSGFCKPCRRIYDTEHYHKKTDKKKKQQLQKDRIARILESVRKIKTESGCKHCIEDEAVCLEFHHTDPSEKDFNIADATRSGFSLKKILSEIDKCIIVCANCHRKIHAGLI